MKKSRWNIWAAEEELKASLCNCELMHICGNALHGDSLVCGQAGGETSEEATVWQFTLI